MAAINDLVNQIEDTALRERIAKEVDRLSKQKKFGLVFEEHLPECTPLYDIPVKVGALVAKKAGEVNDVYKVLGIEDNTAQCLHRESKEIADIPLDDIVTVAEFGEPIYPYLTLSAMHRTVIFGIHLSKQTTTMPCSFWSTSMLARLTASISTHPTIPAQRTGNITMTMWTEVTLTVIASGFPSCSAA